MREILKDLAGAAITHVYIAGTRRYAQFSLGRANLTRRVNPASEIL
jgi:hypothetical protein